MERRLKIVDEHVLKTLQTAGLKGDELSKYLIIWKSLLKEIKPFISKMTTAELKGFSSQILIIIIQFETVCIRAYKPLTGSGSTAKDIIHMYSSKGRAFKTKEIDK